MIQREILQNVFSLPEKYTISDGKTFHKICRRTKKKDIGHFVWNQEDSVCIMHKRKNEKTSNFQLESMEISTEKKKHVLKKKKTSVIMKTQ